MSDLPQLLPLPGPPATEPPAEPVVVPNHIHVQYTRTESGRDMRNGSELHYGSEDSTNVLPSVEVRW